MKKKFTLLLITALSLLFAAAAQNSVPYNTVNMEKYNSDLLPSITDWHMADFAFIASPSIDPVLPKLSGMFVADFNGGLPDIVFFDRNNNTVLIKYDMAVQPGDYSNLAFSDQYDASFYINDGINEIRDVSVGDFNADGIDDIAVVYHGNEGTVSSRIGILSGAGYPGWSRDMILDGEDFFDHVIFMQKAGMAPDVRNVELLDVDDDNIMDLLIADQGQYDAGTFALGAALYILRGGDWVDGDAEYTLDPADPVTSRAYVAPGTKIVIRRPYNLGISLEEAERFGEHLAFDAGSDILFISDSYRGTGDAGSGIHCLNIFAAGDYIGWTSDVSIDLDPAVFDTAHPAVYGYISQPAGLTLSLYLGNTLQTGDINGNNIPDLVAGEYGNPGNDTTGKFYYFSDIGLSFLSANSSVEADSAAHTVFDTGRIPVTVPGMYIGLESLVADIDDDGADDIVLGDHGAQCMAPLSIAGSFFTGAVYVFFNDSAINLSTTVGLGSIGAADLTIYGEHGSSDLGNGLWTADLDGDGHNELYAAATHFSSAYDDMVGGTGIEYFGKVYGFYMNADGMKYVDDPAYEGDADTWGRAVDPNVSDFQTPLTFKIYWSDRGRINCIPEGMSLALDDASPSGVLDTADTSISWTPETSFDPRSPNIIEWADVYVSANNILLTSNTYDLHYLIADDRTTSEYATQFFTENMTVFNNTRPSVTWDAAAVNGLEISVIGPDTSPYFRITYTDPDGNLPFRTLLWVDLNGDLITDTGEIFNMNDSDPLLTDTAYGKQYDMELSNELFQDIFDAIQSNPSLDPVTIAYRFIFSDIELTDPYADNLSAGNGTYGVSVSLTDADHPLPTDPVRLMFPGPAYPGFESNAVEPDLGVRDEDYEFLIEFFNENNPSLLPDVTKLHIYFYDRDLDEGVELIRDLTETDASDTYTGDGKLYAAVVNFSAAPELLGRDVDTWGSYEFEFSSTDNSYVSMPAFEEGTDYKEINYAMSIMFIDFEDALLAYNYVDRGKVNIWIPFAPVIPEDDLILMRLDPGVEIGEVFALHDVLFNPDYALLEEDHVLMPGLDFTRFNFLTQAPAGVYTATFEFWRAGTRIDAVSPALDIDVSLFPPGAVSPVSGFEIENTGENDIKALIRATDDDTVSMVFSASVPSGLFISRESAGENTAIFRKITAGNYEFIGVSRGAVTGTGEYTVLSDDTPPEIYSVTYERGNIEIRAGDDLSGIEGFTIVDASGNAHHSDDGHFLGDFLSEGANDVTCIVSDMLGNETVLERVLTVGIVNPLLSGSSGIYNYPNPFNPSTRIEVHVEKDSRCTLEIFDMRRRLVKRLFSGFLESGIRGFDWDGRDGHGRVCPSGVYYAVFDDGTGRITHKLTLIK